MKIETYHDLMKYVVEKDTCCTTCEHLQKRVMRFGVIEIEKWDSEVCERIIDFKNRLKEVEHYRKTKK